MAPVRRIVAGRGEAAQRGLIQPILVGAERIRKSWRSGRSWILHA